MIGLFEPVCAPWHVDGVPAGFSFGEISPDWDRMGPYVERAMSRVPISFDIGIRKFFCGPESFTPDLQPIVGEAPELRNYFVAAGLNSIGILTGGGLGRVRRPLDRQRPARRRRHRLQHRPPAHLPGEPRVPPHTHGRVARDGVPVPLPHPLDADRARRQAVARPPSPRRGRRLLPRRQRLGGRRLVRRRRQRARSRPADVGAAGVVGPLASRARGGARRA